MWEIVGLALLSKKQLIVHALANDSFMFLKCLLDNIAKAVECVCMGIKIALICGSQCL